MYYTYMFAELCMYVVMYLCMYINVYVYVHVYVYVYVCVYVNVCACVGAYVYRYTHIYIYIYMCMHIYIYIMCIVVVIFIWGPSDPRNVRQDIARRASLTKPRLKAVVVHLDKAKGLTTLHLTETGMKSFASKMFVCLSVHLSQHPMLASP